MIYILENIEIRYSLTNCRKVVKFWIRAIYLHFYFILKLFILMIRKSYKNILESLESLLILF